METNRSFLLKRLSWPLLGAVLFLASSLPLYALSPAPADPELTRLLEISRRLSELNEQLRNELDSSRKNSAELSRMLETSKNELDLLNAELEPLRTTSTALSRTAAISQTELNELRAALSKAGTSLTNLELSWSTYRTAAESQLAKIKKTNRTLRYVTITLGITTLAGWLAFGLAAAN